MKKLFVGSLAWATDDNSLKEFFSQFGEVSSATVVKDRATNRSRGFGFVEFADDAAGDKAIEGASGKELDGREIVVSEAQSTGPKEGGHRDFHRDNRGGGSRGGYGGGHSYRDRDDNRGGSFRQKNW